VSASFLDNLFGLSGRVAVVIGGTGVLGGALAEGIAQAGATTIVAGRGGERGEARVVAIKKLGGAAYFLPVDVTQRTSIEELLAATLKQFQRVDVSIFETSRNGAL